MEIEAWFLADFNHFKKIDPSITVDAIKETLGFDPENDDLALRPVPQDDLNNCYKIGGKEYNKGGVDNTTLEALDFSYFYFELPEKVPQLNKFINSIDDFLA